MKFIIFGLLPVIIHAAALDGRLALPPLVKEDEFHKLPVVARALRDMSAAHSFLDGPGHGPAGSTKKTPFEQLTGQMMNMVTGLMAPQLEPLRSEDLTPRFVKTAYRKKVRYGPFETQANSMNSSARWLKAFCTDCTLLEGRSFVENDKGERQNIKTGIYLHHAIMANNNKLIRAFGTGNICGFPAMQTPSLVILGLSDSSDTINTSPDGSFKSGNYLGPNNKTFWLQSDIVNYSPQPQKLWLAVEYEYLPGQPEGYMDTELLFVSVDVCPFTNTTSNPDVTIDGSGQFLVSSDKPVSVKQDNFIVANDGILLNGLGHLHDGGENILLTLNGQAICNSKAHYGLTKDYVASGVNNPNGKQEQWATISDMDICQIMKPVKKGDKLGIVANYDMRKHPARKDMHGGDEGLMGIIMSQMAVPMSPK